MDDIRQWAFSACAVLTVCAAAGLIMPEGGLRKTFSVTISIFFICSILFPAIMKAPEISFVLQEPPSGDIERKAELLREITEAQTETAAADSVKKIIARKLDAMGIKYTGITINISTNIPRTTSATIEIDSADITLLREYEDRHEIIRRELEGNFGFKIRLGYTDKETGD